MFSAGYTFLWAPVEVGVLQIRDSIFIDGKDVHAPLKRNLERWQRIYGITGRLLCEGAILDPEASADEKLAENLETNNDDGPLRIELLICENHAQNPSKKLQRRLKSKATMTLPTVFQDLQIHEDVTSVCTADDHRRAYRHPR